MMSKLATIAFGAAIAIAPALIHAQTDMGQTGNTSNTANQNMAPGTNNQGNLGANQGNYNPNANSNVNNQANQGAQGTSPNAGINQNNQSMPRTADNWLSWLLCGTTLSGAGLMMRRLRRA
ncbi:MAG TPA: hypothetical protein VKX45_16170 [Bryobacteraceae bacterium]|nr:hypothetical protein [Bryobacteraceae bacterium]